MVNSLEFLINSEKKLVYDIINCHYNDLKNRDDYVNAGFEGLAEAAYRYNIFLNSSFQEFCIPFIINKIEDIKIEITRKKIQ